MTNQEAEPAALGSVSRNQDLRSEVHKLTGVAELFKILSDDTRSKLIYALGQRELCVREMAELMDLSLPAVSHHLRILRKLDLVSARRAGKQVFYSLRNREIVGLIATAVVSARALRLAASIGPVLG
ncbi:MAG: ArsR family transcriptional regulator, lead/cadmium/zinc/bismuth-responsive transcriptional [Bacillota bacterium]|jgi:ArsR family transcriptional regulator|nr:ArsR family transcriptional regulator, lead/cadmium/zinc/bismuth-responsive transcriptional [Bacillota bacterium]MDK2881797.1 ArsR family transcriptional regulator, lead/cadmium/zinc/bismuth-responsive transcriptional [Bacillota bacterium]MDK2960267.1 ArsR family transcriptional regulator, lead/cadmium/zinc/bismuth-responsive transcriptional [Bacillota bacterium]